MIFFLTDFGSKDAYVGIVKAVIAGIAPDTEVIDLGHDLPAQDLRHAAYQLYQAAPYLPEGSTVLVVVDPGVGSTRRALAVEGTRCRWVAPDNGVLSLAFEHDPPRRVHALESPAYRLPDVRPTFHGRDVFGPAAAHLERGVAPRFFGAEVPVDALGSLGVALTSGETGEVLTFDRFGNAITTLREPERDWEGVRIGGRLVPAATHYAAIPVGSPLALIGSSGLVEISIRDGDARAGLGLDPGAAVELVRPG